MFKKLHYIQNTRFMQAAEENYKHLHEWGFQLFLATLVYKQTSECFEVKLVSNKLLFYIGSLDMTTGYLM